MGNPEVTELLQLIHDAAVALGHKVDCKALTGPLCNCGAGNKQAAVYDSLLRKLREYPEYGDIPLKNN